MVWMVAAWWSNRGKIFHTLAISLASGPSIACAMDLPGTFSPRLTIYDLHTRKVVTFGSPTIKLVTASWTTFSMALVHFKGPTATLHDVQAIDDLASCSYSYMQGTDCGKL